MRFLPVFIVVLLASACLSEPDCIDSGSSTVHFRIRDSTNAVTKAIFKSIHVSGTTTVFATAPKDTVSTISLPVNPQEGQTSYVFDYDYFFQGSKIPKHRKDSITVTYTAEKIIVSTTCPPYKKISNLDVPEFSYQEKPLVLNGQLNTSEAINIDIKL